MIQSPLEIVILAAGIGRRMHSTKPKSLHKVAEHTLLNHALLLARELCPARIHVVIGHQGEQIQQATDGNDINWIWQAEQKGTGHAMQLAIHHCRMDHSVLVLLVDAPFFQAKTLTEVVTQAADQLVVLTAKVSNPYGFGRIVRSGKGILEAIIEERHLDHAQKTIKEVNTGVMAAPTKLWLHLLESLQPNPISQEYYLTDCIRDACMIGHAIDTVCLEEPLPPLSINDRAELADACRWFLTRRARRYAEAGLAIEDLNRVDLSASLRFGKDCIIEPDVRCQGRVTFGDRVHIGQGSLIVDCVIDDDVTILPYSVLEGSRICHHAQIGPMAHIRSGSVIGEYTFVGNFAEVKNSHLHELVKAHHFCYIGDATVGKQCNVAAGVVTCNYDGVNKYATIFDEQVFIGANSTLIAPVEIGKYALVAAGSVITDHVPDRHLAISRHKQSNRLRRAFKESLLTDRNKGKLDDSE